MNLRVQGHNQRYCPGESYSRMNQPVSTADYRQNLRREMRRKRRGLSEQQHKQASQGLLRTIRRLPAFQKSKNVAIYLASDGEIDAKPIIDLCWSLGKNCYLPILHPVKHNRLWFMPYTPRTRLHNNKYKILEPAEVKQPRRPAWAMDLVLLPLVAFDPPGRPFRHGWRLLRPDLLVQAEMASGWRDQDDWSGSRSAKSRKAGNRQLGYPAGRHCFRSGVLQQQIALFAAMSVY